MDHHRTPTPCCQQPKTPRFQFRPDPFIHETNHKNETKNTDTQTRPTTDTTDASSPAAAADEAMTTPPVAALPPLDATDDTVEVAIVCRVLLGEAYRGIPSVVVVVVGAGFVSAIFTRGGAEVGGAATRSVLSVSVQPVCGSMARRCLRAVEVEVCRREGYVNTGWAWGGWSACSLAGMGRTVADSLLLATGVAAASFEP